MRKTNALLIAGAAAAVVILGIARPASAAIAGSARSLGAVTSEPAVVKVLIAPLSGRVKPLNGCRGTSWGNRCRIIAPPGSGVAKRAADRAAKGSRRNKRITWLVPLSVRRVAERVTYPGMRPFPRLADEQKSGAI